MSSESPYIGSKISLISKAKIRYEGILYTIDTENATVALSKVRSFGTEDRQCERPVAPRDEVYEYIIFRGTDIEDLTVCEPPKPSAPQPTQTLPQDPAIVQSVVTSQPSVPPPLPPFAAATGPYAQMAANNYSAYMQPRMPYTSLTTGPPPLPSDNKSPLPSSINATSDKAASPVPMGRTSPTSEQGVQAGSPSTLQDHPPQRRTYESNNYYNTRRNNSYEGPQHGQNAEVEGSNRGRGGHRRGYHNRNRDEDYDNRGRGQRRNYYRGNHDGQSQGYRGQKYTRSRRYPSRNDPLRFDGDFDFETANAQFNKEEIAQELMSKLKITDHSKEDRKVKPEEKQDSGVDSGTSHEAAEESDDPDDQACYYDKTKSFFDNITCETNNPRGERMSWTEERKRNTETFGTVWRGRGGYRSRGGYGNRGSQYRGRGRGGYQQQRDDGERRSYYGNRYNQSYERGDNRNQNDGGGHRGRNYYYYRGGGYNRGQGGQSRGRQWVDYEYKYDRRPRYTQESEKLNS